MHTRFPVIQMLKSILTKNTWDFSGVKTVLKSNKTYCVEVIFCFKTFKFWHQLQQMINIFNYRIKMLLTPIKNW